MVLESLNKNLRSKEIHLNPAEFFGTNEFGDNSGSSTVDNNNADVTETNDNRNNSLSTQELVDRDNARYGNTFPQGSFSPTEPKQATKQKEENKFSIRKIHSVNIAPEDEVEC